MQRSKSFLILLSLVTVCVFYATAHPHPHFKSNSRSHYSLKDKSIDQKIDDVIRKHFDRWTEQRKKVSSSRPLSSIKPSSFINHTCIHDKFAGRQHDRLDRYLKSHPEVVRRIEESQEERMKDLAQLRKATTGNIRFYVNDDLIAGGKPDPRACYSSGKVVDQDDTTYTCESDDVVDDELQSFLRESVVPTLTEVFTTVIQLPQADTLYLDNDVYQAYGGECDYDVPIPSSYVNKGISDADFVVFVTARPGSDPNIVAYAGACNFQVLSTVEPYRYGRPLAAIMNFCPRYVSPLLSDTGYTYFEYAASVKVAVHEMTHALGFSSYFYDSYVDSNGQYYSQPTLSSTVTGTSPAGNSYSHNIVKLATPNIVEFARSHFGCNNIDGVELEDYGGSGTAGSHWELRVAGDEYMVGYISWSMPVSGLTLSLFEDMGWYSVDKSKAEYYGWGKDQGCAFVQNRCESSWPSAASGYWCTASSALQCSGDRRAKGVCNIINDVFSAYYQHFSNPNLGGNNAPADFCPFTDGNNVDPPLYCADQSQYNTSGVSALEYFGQDAACFPQTVSSSTTPMCYQYHCVDESTLQVFISGQTFQCPSTGGALSINSVVAGGAIQCPLPSLFCRSVNGFAVNNQLIPSDAGQWSYSDGNKLENGAKLMAILIVVLVAAL